MRTRKQTRRQRNLIDITVYGDRLYSSDEYEVSIHRSGYGCLGKHTVYSKSNVASSAVTRAAELLSVDPGRINIARLVYT